MTALLLSLLLQATAPPMVVVKDSEVMRDEPPPHGAIGMSTAYRISDVVPKRTLEFRKRVLHPGAAIGVHRIDHDEVYYVLSGEGEVVSDGTEARLGPGMAAYLYAGASVGIRQLGEEPLTLIITYPIVARDKNRVGPGPPSRGGAHRPAIRP